MLVGKEAGDANVADGRLAGDVMRAELVLSHPALQREALVRCAP
jgi:hypothetical protein